MLIQFVVQNYLSFRDETIFRMTATNDSRHPNHVVNMESQKISLLRSAAIYGANGAGKSNIVYALYFLRDLVINGIRPKDKILLDKFKLSEESNQSPARFEIELLKNEIHYSYGIVLEDTRVCEEWLFSTRPKGREVRLFERITDKEGNTKIEFGPQLIKANGIDFLSFLEKGTRPEQPFITETESRNVKGTHPVLDWFRDSLDILSPSATYSRLPVRISQDRNFTDALGTFLKAAGTGIEAVETKEEPLDFNLLFPEMSEGDRQEILSGLDGKSKFAVMRTKSDLMLITGNREAPKLLKLYTVHRGKQEKKILFAFGEESSGTKRLVHLFPALFEMINKDRIYVIDELDRSMHPLLSKLFLTSFLENASPNSQLIFTTHEESLLDLDIIRRDEVWFIEKDREEVSHCYPLTDFKIRPDLEIRKGYLNGRFGAVPFFGDVTNLGWCEK
ncbi:MAG: AAA family ATPase [Leptospirales bacterium]